MGLHAAAWLDLSNYCCLETLFRHPLEHLHNPGTGVCGLSAFKHTQGNQKWTVQYGRGASCPECTCMPAMRHHARVVLGRFHSVCRRVLLACMHTCIHTHGDQVDPPPSSPLRYKSTVHTRGPAAPSLRLSICGLQRGEGSTYSADRGRGRWMSPPAYACM